MEEIAKAYTELVKDPVSWGMNWTGTRESCVAVH